MLRWKSAALAVMMVALGAGSGQASDKGAAQPASLVQQALQAAGREKFDEALKLAEQSRIPAAVTLVRWLDLQSPRGRNDFAEISAFITARPDWPLLGPLQKRAEEAINGSTPDNQVLGWYRNRDPLTPEGHAALARALINAGQAEAGAKVLRKAWIDGSLSVAQESLFLPQFADLLRPEDHWARLERLLWDRQEGPALRMLHRVSPEQRTYAEARLALQGGKANAEAGVTALPPQWRDEPGLILDQVRWRRQKDMDEQAMLLLSTHPSRNLVRPESWWSERASLARRGVQAGLITQAYRVASDHGLENRATGQYAEAEFLSGWIALRFADQPSTALTHFQRLWEAATIPASKGKAAYWAGRASQTLNQPQQAREWYERAAAYPTTFYGQLALSRLGNSQWVLPADPQPTPDDRKRLEEREVFQAARLLLQSGQDDAVRSFFIRLNDLAQTAGERALLGEFALSQQRNDLAVTVARRAEKDNMILTGAGWPLLSYAEEEGPEKALTLALIRQESGFSPTIQSSVGARGLMQLMPATAEREAKLLKLPYAAVKLDEPAYNIRLGRSYLSGVLNSFDGSYIMALAGYNAGPTRVKKWIKDFGDPRDPNVDAVDWIEMIPFTETRGYVQKVMESVALYRRKLNSAVQPPLDNDLKRSLRRAVDSSG